jgi:hypothetical protein
MEPNFNDYQRYVNALKKKHNYVGDKRRREYLSLRYNISDIEREIGVSMVLIYIFKYYLFNDKYKYCLFNKNNNTKRFLKEYCQGFSIK